uniref:Uncharacterized protein n=1 Tax=Avena sativa TaxID=4498 RepID=A0ACD5YUD8_AVESA
METETDPVVHGDDLKFWAYSGYRDFIEGDDEQENSIHIKCLQVNNTYHGDVLQLSISHRSAAPRLQAPNASCGTTVPWRRAMRLRAESVLPAGLRAESLPRHVAMVMDGNSRWARARGLPTAAGHEALKPALEEAVWLSRAWGIRALTAFAFSHENWSRPKACVTLLHSPSSLLRSAASRSSVLFFCWNVQAEVDFLMDLFERLIQENVAEFVREGIRLRVIGDCTRLPVSLQKTVREAEEATSNNLQLDLILAISYSGRRDIVQACANLAHKVRDELLGPNDIDESLFADELQTNCANEFPYPDLLIRTGGEVRLSNFLMWQSAYSELFFTSTLWPDFREADYVEALIYFQGRDRRFGQRKTLA